MSLFDSFGGTQMNIKRVTMVCMYNEPIQSFSYYFLRGNSRETRGVGADDPRGLVDSVLIFR